MAPSPPRTLDTIGLKCPLPVLKARKALEPLAAGARLVVLANDPMAKIDMAHMCARDGHTLIAATENDRGQTRFEIEKGG